MICQFPATPNCPLPATASGLCPTHALLLPPAETNPLPKSDFEAQISQRGAASPATSEAASGDFERLQSEENSPEPRSGCQGTTRFGKPCGFDVAVGAGYCINHFPDRDRTAAHDRSARGGRASGETRRLPTARFLETVLSFNDRPSIQAVLDTVVRMTLAGRLDKTASATILRAASIAARNFDPPRETLAGPAPQEHEWWDYITRVEALLQSVDRLIAPTADPETETEA